MKGALTPATAARVKRGVQAAIAANEGVVDACKTVGREKSTVGRWNARGEPDLPPLDAAIALDQVALSAGRGAPIAEAYALELGGVMVMLPTAPQGDGEVFDWLARLTSEVGDVMRTAAEMLADGKISDREVDDTVKQLDEVLQVGTQMRVALLARRSVPQGGK